MLTLVATSVTACGTTAIAPAGPRFHHALLNRSWAPPAARRDASLAELAPVRHRRAERCTLVFSHPLLNHCESWPVSGPRAALPSSPGPAQRAAIGRVDNPIEHRLSLAQRARTILSRREPGRFRAGGRAFRRDCSGFVLALYASEGFDLQATVRAANGRGRGRDSVAGIYRAVRRMGLVHRNKVPAVGDLVFFDHTFDRNRDGKVNDPLTHIGIVERIDADGTVTVIHHVQRGVLRYRMNRFRPDLRRDPATNRVLNHYLRVGPAQSSARRLTGQLFHAFATVIR